MKKAVDQMVKSLTSGSSLETYIKSCLKDPKGVLTDLSVTPSSSGSPSVKSNESLQSSKALEEGNGSSDPNEDDNYVDAQSSTEETNTDKVISSPSLDKNNGESTTKRQPVCKLTWLLKECTIVGCKKSHPPICRNSNCQELDQDLPRWKSIGCTNWHGRSKPKQHQQKKPTTTGKLPSSKPAGKSIKKSNINSHGSRLQSKGPHKPHSKPHQCSHNQSKTTSQNNWPYSGNGQATWPPLTSGGSAQWGKMPYNLAARGLGQKRPTQMEFIQETVQTCLAQLLSQGLPLYMQRT